MDRREHVRYSIGLLPEALNTVVFCWKDEADFEVNLVDYSKKGLKVSVRSSQNQIDLPSQGEKIRVRAPSDQRWISGKCVHVRSDSNGTISIGVFIEDEKDQELLEEQFLKVLDENREPIEFINRRWEETVGKLCDSSSTAVREMGLRYKQELMDK